MTNLPNVTSIYNKFSAIIYIWVDCNFFLHAPQPVGQALVYSLQTGLQDKFTPEVKEGWLTLYAVVQHFMTLGMEGGLEI